MMKKQAILEKTVRSAIEENRAAFVSKDILENPARFLVRLADQARSNAFLWLEAALGVQEKTTRAVPAGQTMARSLALATVAADIYVGYTTLRDRAKWFPSLVKPHDWELQHQRSANRILETAGSLGGALIKACQFASTRPDLLPATYIRILAPLQDSMPPRSWPEVEKAINRELGRPAADIFAEIEHEPIAAASIGQVHRARLHDGREVAVKVQYPDIANLIATDMAVLEQVVKAIARLEPSIQLQPIIDYLNETLPLELDFKHEAASMDSLRKALAYRPDVVVPEVVKELSTERLLVMEFIQGIKITDKQGLEQAGISPQEVARLLNDLYADQMLHLGILHADPHPGNLRVQPGPRLVLLDHGLTVPLSPPLVSSLRRMVQAITAGDFNELTEALVAAGVKFEGEMDIPALLNMVGVLLGSSQTGESKEDVDALDVGMKIGKSIGTIPTDLLLLGRALGLIDGITRQLDPNLDTIEIIAHYT